MPVPLEGTRDERLDATGEVENLIIPSDDCTLTLGAPLKIETFIRAEIVAGASYEILYKIAQPALSEAPIVEELISVMSHQPIRRAISNPIYFGY